MTVAILVQSAQIRESSRSGKHGGEQGSALGHGFVVNKFLRGVRAVAHSAEAIERGNAESGGEISIGATTGWAFSQRKSHLLRERFGAQIKRGALFALERRAVKAAADFQSCAAADGLQRTETLFQSAHIGQTPGAKIDIYFGAIGDDVGACAALDDVRIDGNAVAEIVPFFEASDLRGEFVNGVHALIGIESGVGGATMHHEFDFAHTFA